MTVGDNTLVASIKPTGKSGKAIQARLAIKNYPITGPILSGPHMKPYECRTVESGLGQPLDSNCSAAKKVEYFYRSSNNTFKHSIPGLLDLQISSTLRPMKEGQFLTLFA
jgi:hypothetical protein